MMYYLKGWIIGTPGEDSMPFNIPPETEDVTVVCKAQDPSQANKIRFTHRVARGMVWIEWFNWSEEDVNFDYEITPIF